MVVWVLVLLSIGLLVVEPFVVGARTVAILEVVDEVVLGLLVVEYVLRVASLRPAVLDVFDRPPLQRFKAHVVARLRLMSQPLMVVDLVSVLAVVPALRGLRALRLLRLLRSTRIFRYGNPFTMFLNAFEHDRVLFTFAFSVLGIETLLGGLSLYLIERAETARQIAAGADPSNLITSVGDGIWWALVTITTVGYGDYTPQTMIGRVVGGVLMVAGMFTLALFAGIVGHSLLNAVLSIRSEQIRMSDYVDHIVVCGYEEGSSMLMEVLMDEVDLNKKRLVLIGPGDRPADLPGEALWVQGDPTKESELDKVRMTHASTVIVIGPRSSGPRQADATTILTTFTIRSYLDNRKAITKGRRRSLHVIAEILESENVDHARAAGVDEVIESRRLGFEIIAHSVSFHGVGDATSQMVTSGAQSFYVGELPEEAAELGTFRELADALRAKHGALVVGLIDPKTGFQRLNPGDHEPVDHNHVIYLADQASLKIPV